ncbi:sterile alpha motif domain-containing protein 1 [Clarias gariepinus]
MSEPRYREWILETIDSLRSRKARPDLERICRMVRRRHGSDPDRTRAELEKLIQEQTVLKVNYKGSVSYRNAAKVQRKCRRKVETCTKHADGISAEREPSPGSRTRSAQEKRGEEEKEEEGEGDEDEEEEEESVVSPATDGSGGGGGGETHASSDLREPERRTCASARNNKQQQQLRAARSGGTAGGDRDRDRAEDLGDRLVAAVWSLSERNSRSHNHQNQNHQHAPLGLREILGFLGTQAGGAHTGAEKLTRSRVNVVLEREIERGRLRRTRLGHISAVPARRGGGGGGAAKASEASARLPASTSRSSSSSGGSGSAPQDGRVSPQEQVKEEKVMKVKSEEVDKMDEEAEPPKESERQSSKPEGEAEDKVHTPASLSAGLKVKECEDPHTPPVTEEEEQLRLSPLPSPSKLSSGHQEPEQAGTEVEMVMEGESLHTESVTQDQREAVPDQIDSLTQDEAVVISDSAAIPPSIPIKSYSVCKAEVGVSSCLLTPSASPGAAEERGMNGGVFVKSETSITNPVDWTVADVASYFTAAGFPEQALAFRMQEIDGKSLLLMQRNDVLTGLSIRLGPALKIYERHVKVLQRTHFQDDEAFC